MTPLEALATLTPERLREVLRYEPSTGLFRWRIKRGRQAAGSVAGCKHKVDGRIYIGIDGRLYKAHRLAWLYVHGAWPSAGLDHRDGVPDHNWFDNLRPASTAENMQNLKRAHRDSRTGLLGVSHSRGGFSAVIQTGNQRKHLGRFPTADQAHAAYLRAKRDLHPFATNT